MIIYFALAMGVVEYASAVELYRQFIYEETCQSAQMMLFTFSQLLGDKDTKRIGGAAAKYGLNPGRKDLKDFGWMIPWATEALDCFYWAMEYSLKAF